MQSRRTPTATIRTALTNPFIANLREQAKHFGLTMLEPSEPGHGIMHVIAPELGITLPGLTLCCSDSHSCTNGALGCARLGYWRGRTDPHPGDADERAAKAENHADQGGRAPARRHPAKDLILRLIGEVGVAAGNGYAVEYAGSAIRELPMEARFTVCNMSVEFGARFGMIAPDETTLAYVAGRPYAPRGTLWDAAVADWRGLASDPEAQFDHDVAVDVTDLTPQVTWGNNPAAVLPVDGCIPDPTQEGNAVRRHAMEAALAYMDLRPVVRSRAPLMDWVFIGSCTNGRISDLRAAAAIVKGRKVAAEHPRLGRAGLKRASTAAEAEGLDRIFRAAGFEWREPGCSMCPRRQRRHRAERPAQRVDFEPQLRRPPGPGQPDPPRKPGRGGSFCLRRRDRRPPQIQVRRP